MRKITRDGVISTFAGTGTRGSEGDGGPATAAQLNQPQGLVADSAGRVYIADAASVRRVDSDGVIRTVMSQTDRGDPIAPGGLAVDSADDLIVADRNGAVWRVKTSEVTAVVAGLAKPWGVAVDQDDNLYIAESAAGRVRSITRGGELRGMFGGFSAPYGIRVDTSGNLYVADLTANRVWRLSVRP